MSLMDLKTRVQNRLIAGLEELDPWMDVSQTAEVRAMFKEMYDAALQEEIVILGRKECDALFEQIMAEILGLGPLEPLLTDASLTEIMCNGPRKIFVERKGKLRRVNLAFESDEHLMGIIDRIVSPLGLHINENSPYMNACLKDGSPINIIIPPASLNGPTVTIYRPLNSLAALSTELTDQKGVTEEAFEFLRACVEARQRILVCGTANSGKTTFLAMLANLIPQERRVIIIDDGTYRLPISNDNSQHLTKTPTYRLGDPGLSVYEQLCIAANIENVRLILPEVEQGQFWNSDILDVLAQTNYIAEFFGPSSQSALLYLADKCLHRGTQWPAKKALQSLINSVDLFVCLGRMPDGTRKVVSIDVISLSDTDTLQTRPLFIYKRTGYEDNRVIGQLQPTEFLKHFTII